MRYMRYRLDAKITRRISIQVSPVLGHVRTGQKILIAHTVQILVYHLLLTVQTAVGKFTSAGSQRADHAVLSEILSEIRNQGKDETAPKSEHSR